MKKEETIRKYGIEVYKKRLEQTRAWRIVNPDKVKAQNAAWDTANPEKRKAWNAEVNRRDGKYYKKTRERAMTGVQHEKNIIRSCHYRKYRAILTSESQLHHEWIPGTSRYRGLALVKKDPHHHGFIEVIKVLEGEITLFTEKEVRESVE